MNQTNQINHMNQTNKRDQMNVPNMVAKNRTDYFGERNETTDGSSGVES